MTHRVLVTGTSGFIASHLALLLAQRGYVVYAYDVRPPALRHPGVHYLQCDLLDLAGTRAAVREAAPQSVLHLAARTDLDEKRDLRGYAANIEGVSNLAEALQANGGVRRAIVTSTQLVCRIGYRPQHDQDYAPSTLYGESKVQTERLWRAADGTAAEWCIVRPTTIWGPRMNPHYLRFFRLLRDGRYFHVGRGPTYKHYGFVGNTVFQYLRLLEAPTEQVHGRVFYLADYEPISLEGWAEGFRRALQGPPIRTLPLPLARAGALVGDLLNRSGFSRFPFNSFRLNNVLTPYQVDMEPTRAVCGTLPYSMEDGILQTASWIRDIWNEETSRAS